MFKGIVTKKEIGPLFLILIMLVFALAFWRSPCLPAKIPTHWNAQGRVDNYHSKGFVFLFYPSLSIGIYLLLLFLPLIRPLRSKDQRFTWSYFAIRMLALALPAALYFYIVFHYLGYY